MRSLSTTTQRLSTDAATPTARLRRVSIPRARPHADVRRSRSMSGLIVVGVALLSLPIVASASVYRCETPRGPLFSQTPCADDAVEVDIRVHRPQPTPTPNDPADGHDDEDSDADLMDDDASSDDGATRRDDDRLGGRPADAFSVQALVTHPVHHLAAPATE